MAKILVADDNSNVQKTVTLALANLGIDVVAVNNGDAAVRKLADFTPDLVLADIFMPVRNGYEVCEYVKKDSRFAHVPVVLLVGAFDPLDEKEAQRVGADGILKKPFVPPDPLMTMVKMLLERTLGTQLVEVSASKPVLAARARSGGSGITEDRPLAALAAEESPAHDLPASPGRVALGQGEQPVAFSQMLGIPEDDAVAPAAALIEPVDDEQMLTSSRDATLGDPIFWRNDEPESEPEPETEHVDEDISSSLGVHTWKLGDDSLPRRDDALLLQPLEPIRSIEQIEPDEPLEFVPEGQDETSRTVVESETILLDPAGQAPLTVESDQAKELAANPLEWMATAASRQSLEVAPEISQEDSTELSLEQSEDESDVTPGWDEPISDSADTIDEDEDDHTPVTSREQQRVAPPVSVPASMPVSVPVLTPLSVPVPASAVRPDPVQASAPATLQIEPPVAPTVSAQPETKQLDTAADPNKTRPSIRPSAQTAEDKARSVPKQDWADLTASIQSRASEVVQAKVSPVPTPVPVPEPPAAPINAVPAGNLQSAPATPTVVSSPDPALVEAVVQRVLDKMRPQVVDIITKEFLRPIVQALVTREVEKH